MPLTENLDRAQSLARRLRETFSNLPMPEDAIPNGLVRNSPNYRLFLTLVVAIDYNRDADSLWSCARRTYENPKTRYLFELPRILQRLSNEVKFDLKESGLLLRPYDFRTWMTLCQTFYEQFAGDPLNLLVACDMDGPRILYYLLTHGSQFPYLKGQKIGPLWLRMLRDNAGLSFKNLEEITIPVDVHVLRATLCLGTLTGEYEGPLEPLKEKVGNLWKRAVHGQGIRDPDGNHRSLISLDLDEALWTIGRTFCNKKISGMSVSSCPGYSGCATGNIFVTKDRVRVQTKMGRKTS